MYDSEFPFRDRSGQREVATDFESRVWGKIRRVHKRRRTAGVVAGLAAGALLLSVFLLRQTAPRPPLSASVPTAHKEEVPLTENMVFAVYDSRTLYSIEPVSYSPRKERPARREI